MAFTRTNIVYPDPAIFPLDANGTWNEFTAWQDTGLSIPAGQQMVVKATGEMSPYAGTVIRPKGHPRLSTTGTNVFIPGRRFCMLIGKFGVNGTPFPIGAGRNVTRYYSGSDNLFLCVNDVQGFLDDNTGSFSVTIDVGTFPVCSQEAAGIGHCDSPVVNPLTRHPIDLYSGEKREHVVDLRLNTPSGELAFARTYRQTKLADSNFQFMGLGWTHSHLSKLTLTGTAPNRSASVLIPDGGLLKLIEASTTPGHFDPESGSSAVLDFSSGTSEYVLTFADKRTYVYDAASFLLKRRTWPNTEVWTYTYVAGKLDKVTDGYGRELRFAYVSNAGQFNDGQLWRVGDQTATGLSGATPAGRYVELTYVTEKLNGVVVSSPKALLSTIRDVRGNLWTYDWYGQDVGENDSARKNFLLEVQSPQVDTDGDGITNASITLKQLIYAMTGSVINSITQKRGLVGAAPALIETTYAFQAGGQNVTHETTANLQSQHQFSGGVYAGMADPAGNLTSQSLEGNYRTDEQQDANGNQTTLLWGENGKLLDSAFNALGQETRFIYNETGSSLDTVDTIRDPDENETRYTYGDAVNPRLPTVIEVYNKANVRQSRREFVYDAKGRVLQENTRDPVNTGTLLQQTTRAYGTAGNDNGLLKTVTVVDVDTPANNTSTTYSYDAAGRLIKTQQSSLFGSCQTSFTLYDPAGNVVVSICNYDQGANPDPMTEAAAIALYNPSLPDKNKVTTHEYDSLNRRIKSTVNAGASFAQTSLTFYDALDRVVRTITNYVNQNGGSAEAPATWIWDATDNRWEKSTGAAIGHGADNTQNLIADTDFNARGMVRFTRDTLGKVTLYGYNSAGRLIKTIQSASQPSYNNDYIIRPGLSGTPNATLDNYAVVTSPDQDIVTMQDYDRAGNLVKSVDVLGNVSFTVYDALNRVVKTVGNAKDTATIALNPGDAGYNEADDPRSANYVPDTGADRDHIQTTEYDTLGRVIRQTDVNGRVTYSVYDSLGRIIRTIANYVPQGTTNPANWFWSETTKLWTTNGVTPIDLGPKNDQNNISLTVYDTAGRVMYTQDMLGRRLWNRYDALNRVTRTVANAVGIATNFSSTDPRSDSYMVSPDSDKDRIVRTDYDTDGRVATVTDPNGRKTQNAYDTMGRLSRQISNYVVQGSSLPTNWVWSSANNRWENGAGVAISFGTDNDENRISLTEYDSQGRVARIRDAAGIETRHEYDTLGRRTRSITNYVDGVFNSAFPDEDLISTTLYDRAGRVITTTDPRGTQTSFTYDRLGRRLTTIQAANTALATANYTCYDKAGHILRTIQNWSNTPGQPSPDAKDAGGNWLFNPSSSTPDRDLINEQQYDRVGRRTLSLDPLGNSMTTVYDKDGQVIAMTDPENVVTRHVYDRLWRRTRVIQSYKPVSYMAFISEETGNRDIFVARPDGTGRVNLTLNAARDSMPAWSPDGSKLVFASNRNGAVDELYVMNPDGSGLQQLTTLGGFVANPAWSPDGSKIAFVFGLTFGFNSYRNLYVINADGTGLKLLYNDLTAYDMGRPAWSPDGQFITFYHSYSATEDAIDLMLVDGTGHSELTPRAERNRHAQWSPDGSRIVFESSRSGTNDVYIMNANGTGQINLTANNPTTNDRLPFWSPDGTRVFFDTDRDGNRELYSMNPDGSNQIRLTNNLFNDLYPALVDNAPSLWKWSSTNNRWEDGLGNAIDYGANNDQNIIVEVSYDRAGRVLNQREPRGNLTVYEYDQLDRRTKLTNPLNIQWLSSYSDLSGNKTRQTMTYPGLGSGSYAVNRDFDKLGRLQSVAYGDPATTPDVRFTYDAAGNRQKMSEFSAANFTNRVRETTFGYDDVRRLTSVGFDNDGNGTVDETVSYQYDAGGLRTRLTMPGNLNINYTYDAKGQLIGLTDWDTQQTSFAYDLAGRHIATERANRLRSAYQYDAGGRLRVLRHSRDNRTLAHFAYEVDRRGNRTRAQEVLAHPTTTTDTTIPFNDKGLVAIGAWADVGGFKETTAIAARLSMLFFGNQATLTMGTGPDHGIYDVYVGGSLWQSFDGYTVATGQMNIPLVLTGSNVDGPYPLEIRARREKSALSIGFKVRFNQLVITDTTYTLHTITYAYDQLARLRDAKYCLGFNTAVSDTDLLRRYQYQFDRSGNRTQQIVTVGGVPTTNNYMYNAANQLTSGGATYDPNGNLTNDGTNATTWDRANRMRTFGGADYSFDGIGNRVSQTVGATVTRYLLDLQPGLAVVLSETAGVATTRYVHSPRGIHAQKDTSGNWEWLAQDGLSSVRQVVDGSNNLLWSTNYDSFGTGFAALGTAQSPYGFTGEPTLPGGLLHLRARNYNPALGVFTALDPFEGIMDRAMSLNGYSWVEGNTSNAVDPRGMCAQPTEWWNPVDVNCYYSVVGLAQRFSQGNSQAYNEWFNVLITKPWHELKSLEALGTVNDATILPSLALRAEPEVVIDAIKQFMEQATCGFGSNITLASIIALPGASGTAGIGLKGIGIGALIGLSIGIGISALLGLNAIIDAATDTDNQNESNEEFVGFHGTAERFTANLTGGIFDNNLAGTNTAGGASNLQFGLGLYVVKATSIYDDNALGMAEFFALQASQNHLSPAIVLKVYARGFSSMRRLYHIGTQGTLPNNFTSLYDYIEGPIQNWPGYTQVKFNPHVFPRLSIRL